MARLDRSSAVKEIAQVGATIGREFSYELLAAVAPKAKPELDAGLDQLIESGLAFRRGAPPAAIYTFKHALVQDAAYDSLLKSTRQELHATIARALANHFPQTVEAAPELLAHHLTAAGQHVEAIGYWQMAGEQALKRIALKEAIAHLNRGMDLIGTLSPSAARDGQELDLRTRLGTAWMALKGWGAPEVWTSFHPALGLVKSLERREPLLTIYYGLTTNVLTQGRIVESLPWVNEMLAAAETSKDSGFLIEAERAACATRFWMGDLAECRAHGDRVMALYHDVHHRHLADLTVTDPKTVAGYYASLGTWLQGFPDLAVQVAAASIGHSRRRQHPFDLGFMLTFGGQLFDFRGEPAQILARVEEAERLGRTHSLPFITDVSAQLMKGIAWIRAGRVAEGIPLLQRALELWRANDMQAVTPYFRAAIAEGLALGGKSEDGLRLIEENLTQIARPGWEERVYLAEFLRLKAWMLSLQGDLDGAEQNYQSSLAWAREQQAKSWELRTATGLARLWQSQGKHREAQALLAPIYGWFTEGFDTKDLKDAKAVLSELESPLGRLA